MQEIFSNSVQDSFKIFIVILMLPKCLTPKLVLSCLQILIIIIIIIYKMI